ncbi:MAG: PH domain-containing protein [Anaerolineae bacterium]
MKHYKAHWGIPLIVVSSLLTVLCLGIAYEAFMQSHTLFGLLLLALILGCALFTIRGYTVTPDAILIHRLFWATRLPLAGLQSAQFQPRVMRWSIRCGNGGFFSITGFYWSKLLGVYRAFVTDLRRTVVLRYTGRTVVVSPSSPEEFVHELVPTHDA